MEFKNSLKTGVSAVALTAGLGILVSSAPVQAGIAGPSLQNLCAEQFTPGLNQTSFVLDSVTPNGSGQSYDFTLCNTSDVFGGGTGEGLQFEFLAIRDWELPFFGTDLDTDNDALITNIRTPDGGEGESGWRFGLEEIGIANPATGWDGIAQFQVAGDPFREFFDALYGAENLNNPFNNPNDLGPDGLPNTGDENPGQVTHVLHWYTNECSDGFFDEEANQGQGEFIEGQDFCDQQEQEFTDFFDPIDPSFFGEFTEDNLRTGFGFDSPFSSGAAPYQASWVNVPTNTGDPQFPLGGGSPDPGIGLLQINVPEPGALALFGSGLAGLFFAGRRRRRKDEDGE